MKNIDMLTLLIHDYTSYGNQATSFNEKTRTYPSAPDIANIESSCEKSTVAIYLGRL
jgi:hypothetical protein